MRFATQASILATLLGAVPCMAQQAGQAGVQVKISPTTIARAGNPAPRGNAQQKASVGKGGATIGTLNAPGDTDSLWAESLDVDGDGNMESADFLWDDEDKVLFISYEDDFTCSNGAKGSGAILIGLNGAGNARNRPAGSGFYVVSLDLSECAAQAAGLWGCKFDASGNATACGAAVVDEKGDEIVIAAATQPALAKAVPAQQKKPNILFIMGDDVGWFNVGAYHRGIMSGKTPNLDKLAAEGMLFTDYYAEASCTAGRANFITGEIPLRTGLTTVGLAGADVGLPDQACTLATALKAQGYATGQFGKNHLGDLNKYLPTVHGFDEFFGYLYHLDAMSDPYWYSFPNDPAYRNKYGPRSLVHCWATDKDDPTDQPRWGKVGKQKITDEGPLAPFPNMSNVPNMHDITPKAKYDMGTFDEVLVKASSDFMDKAKKDGKPFFIWHNTTRMHVWTFLSPKYQALMNSQTNYGLEEAGVAQMDDCIGALLKHLNDIGEADNTIVVFTTDNGAEVFTWPDGGMTPFKATKGTVMEGGFRVPCIARWPGHIHPGTVENGIMSGLDWFPTLCAAAGNPDITNQLLKGVKLGDRTYKNHLDGYNQMNLLTGYGPSERHELFYFGGPKLGAIRVDDFKFQFYQQPQGWPGPKVTTDMPLMVNIRQDPFERTPSIGGQSINDLGGGYMNDFYAREFWRFVLVQQTVAKLAETAIDYPPMQDPASFNLDAVKKQIEAMIKEHHGQ